MKPQKMSFVFDFDGVLWQTRRMMEKLDDSLTRLGVLQNTKDIFPLYNKWKQIPSNQRGTFVEGFPQWLAQQEHIRGKEYDVTALTSLVCEISGGNWVHPNAAEVLAQLPKEQIFVVTCGDTEGQKKKLITSGLVGRYLDWSRIRIVSQKNETAFRLAVTEMGIVGPIVHINDRLDELQIGLRAFPNGIPVWLGDRTGEEYGFRGKEMDQLFGIRHEQLPNCLHIFDLAELPGALRQQRLL